MKQHHIPEQQDLQIHRCVNLRTECQSKFVPSAAMRHGVIIWTRAVRGWQCNLCTKISQVKTLPDKTSTDDNEDTDNEMHCSRWTVSSTRNVRLHGRKNWRGSTVFWSDIFAVAILSCRSTRVGAGHYRTTLLDKRRTQWPWGRRVVYLLSLGPCN